MRLDDNDLKILDLLSINSKLKIKEIAGKLKMKNATAAYHLGKINGITTKKAIINNYLIGSSQFKLFIKLMDFDQNPPNRFLIRNIFF